MELHKCAECRVLPELHIVPGMDEADEDHAEQATIRFIAHCIGCDAGVELKTGFPNVGLRNAAMARAREGDAENPAIAAWNQWFGEEADAVPQLEGEHD